MFSYQLLLLVFFCFTIYAFSLLGAITGFCRISFITANVIFCYQTNRNYLERFTKNRRLNRTNLLITFHTHVFKFSLPHSLTHTHIFQVYLGQLAISQRSPTNICRMLECTFTVWMPLLMPNQQYQSILPTQNVPHKNSRSVITSVLH